MIEAYLLKDKLKHLENISEKKTSNNYTGEAVAH
jgi:hypothetical protein